MINEVYVFLSAMGSGAAAGFLYDLFRLKRKAMKTKAFLIGLEDIFFWVITSILVFITAYFSSEGEVRLYFLFAALAGVLIYYWILSRLVIQILTLLVKAVLWPFVFLLRVLKPPVKWLWNIIGQGTDKTRSKLHMAGVRMNRRFRSIRHIMRKV
jgi:spore cortex biosynthesis protein YabQ